ncbi:predicted protein [Chaetoceros tenuissimus]|uniref:Uncharacterized protein n=1 Tax=Chaetoceros tenuissimus TaxID=426638 RepID=A0AAD3CMZ4_9STRA|nr:predicted protein [Chaetoceros tenuissimus]
MKHFQLSDEASVDMEAPIRKKALVQKLKLFNKLKQGKQQIKQNRQIISPENVEKKNLDFDPIDTLEQERMESTNNGDVHFDVQFNEADFLSSNQHSSKPNDVSNEETTVASTPCEEVMSSEQCLQDIMKLEMETETPPMARIHSLLKFDYNALEAVTPDYEDGKSLASSYIIKKLDFDDKSTHPIADDNIGEKNPVTVYNESAVISLKDIKQEIKGIWDSAIDMVGAITIPEENDKKTKEEFVYSTEECKDDKSCNADVNEIRIVSLKNVDKKKKGDRQQEALEVKYQTPSKENITKRQTIIIPRDDDDDDAEVVSCEKTEFASNVHQVTPDLNDSDVFEDIEDDYEEYLDSPDKEIHTKAVSKKVIDSAFDNQNSYSPFEKILSKCQKNVDEQSDLFQVDVEEEVQPQIETDIDPAFDVSVSFSPFEKKRDVNAEDKIVVFDNTEEKLQIDAGKLDSSFDVGTSFSPFEKKMNKNNIVDQELHLSSTSDNEEIALESMAMNMNTPKKVSIEDFSGEFPTPKWVNDDEDALSDFPSPTWDTVGLSKSPNLAKENREVNSAKDISIIHSDAKTLLESLKHLRKSTSLQNKRSGESTIDTAIVAMAEECKIRLEKNISKFSGTDCSFSKSSNERNVCSPTEIQHFPSTKTCNNENKASEECTSMKPTQMMLCPVDEFTSRHDNCPVDEAHFDTHVHVEKEVVSPPQTSQFESKKVSPSLAERIALLQQNFR